MAICVECYAWLLFLFREMKEVGFQDEDWMELPCEEGLNVIYLPWVTNIPSASASLTVGLEEDEPTIPEARCVEPPIEVEPVASVSVPSQSTYLLPSSIKSKLVNADLERIKTIYGILVEYQLRVAFITSFRFLFPKLIRDFFCCLFWD